jgi:hypothetical protein
MSISVKICKRNTSESTIEVPMSSIRLFVLNLQGKNTSSVTVATFRN